MRNNKGFTLVELIIAISISVIVLGCATLLLGNAQKSYRYAEETIDLQKESQILMEQLSTMIMECNRYDIQGNRIVLYNVSRFSDRTGVDSSYKATPVARIIWQTDNKLYCVQVDGNPKYTDAQIESIVGSNTNDDNCISELMHLFRVTKATSNPQRITIELELKQGNQMYSLINDIMIRNELIARR